MISVFNSIADDLAEHGFAVTDQFLSQSEVDNILSIDAFRQGHEHLKKAAIGKNTGHQINEAIRGDYIQWLDKSSAPDPAKLYLDRLSDLTQFLNQALYLSLKDYEVHF